MMELFFSDVGLFFYFLDYIFLSIGIGILCLIKMNVYVFCKYYNFLVFNVFFIGIGIRKLLVKNIEIFRILFYILKKK